MSEERGAEAFGHRTVTEASVSAFGVLTGDYARLHFDHEFAERSGGRIAHGLLGASWAIGAMTLHAPELLGVGKPNWAVSEFSARFLRSVFVGDTLSFRVGSADEAEGPDWEVVNQRGEITSAGRIRARDWTSGSPIAPPAAWPAESWIRPSGLEVFHAEDLFEARLRGECSGRTLTEAEAIGFATEVGELNPMALNAEFAHRSVFGERVAPPMFTFCLAFADFLRDLLELPMPEAGFGGHLGDSWRALAPVLLGDTLRTGYRTLSCRPSKSRPEMAIVCFGLQTSNQRGALVQDGEVVMMIPRRPAA